MKGKFYTCTISRDDTLLELKSIMAPDAETALQAFMAPRRHKYLKRHHLPTWFGSPTVCEMDNFSNVNDGFVIEAKPLVEKYLLPLAGSTKNPGVEAAVRKMESGEAEIDCAVMRKLDKLLFRLIEAFSALGKL